MNKNEALKMFLEYIFDETENKNEIETIVETYVNKKLKDYFDVVANKIDELDNKIYKMEKPLNKPASMVDHVAAAEVTPKNNGNAKKPKRSKSKKKSLDEKILNCIPEMTESEADEYFKRIKDKCKGVCLKNLSSVLVRDATSRNIAKKLGYKDVTIGNHLRKLRKRDDIRYIRSTPVERATIVYVRIIPEHESLEDVVNPDSTYQWKTHYSNPGYELINNQYIKTKKGKPLDITAEQLKKVSEKVNGKILTIHLFNECRDYLKKCGVPEDDCERIMQHLTKGYFSIVLVKYEKYLKTKFNARFEVHKGTLLVNGKDTKLTVKEVKAMIDNYPYGYPEKRIEEYIRGLIDKYTFCPADCIRVILMNREYSSLKHLIKEKEPFVENNPRKRKEKGIIPG